LLFVTIISVKINLIPRFLGMLHSFLETIGVKAVGKTSTFMPHIMIYILVGVVLTPWLLPRVPKTILIFTSMILWDGLILWDMAQIPPGFQIFSPPPPIPLYLQ